MVSRIRICIKLGLYGPYFGTPISTSSDKVFVDKSHFLGRLRMSVDDQARMSVSRSVVVLNPIFTGTSDDFTGVELKRCYWVFESVSLGDGTHSNIPYLRVRKQRGSG